MRYYTITPPEALAPFVRSFWVLESDEPSYIHRAMADVSPEMVFHYKGRFSDLHEDCATPSFLAALQGPSDTIKRFSIREPFGIFGIYFYPYAIPLLTRSAAPSLKNQLIDVASLLGRDGAELEEKMMLAPDNTKRAKIISDFLVQRLLPESLKKTTPVFRAVHEMITTRCARRVSDMADRYAMSERQFERRMLEYTGFSPKRFTRIVRFHAACSQYGSKNKSLLDIAVECGYYDQSHFIHEFKQFSGHHPKAYFHGAAEGNEWRQ